eukprot:Gb_09032 [translate_table: standard]
MKHIYSDLEGEMHWSTNVCHAPENVHGNVHLILRTSYLWVLSGGLYESGVVPFPLYKDQDQVNIQFPLAKHKSLSDSSVNQDRVKHKSVDSNFSGKEEKISGYSGIDRIMSNEHWDSIYSTVPFDNCKILGKKQRNRLIVPLQYDKEREKRRIPCPNSILRIPRNFPFFQSVAKYGIHDGSNRTAPFYLDLLGEEDNLQVQVGNYILYGDGEQIQLISDTSIQLVRTCSVLNWEQKDSMEEAYAFLTEVRINEVVRNFLQISLMKYPGGKRKNVTGSKFLFHNRSDQTNTFSSNRGSQFFSKHQGTIRTLPNEEKEGGSFAVLSPFDCSQTILFSGSKYYDMVKRSIQEDPMMQINELSCLLGNLHSIANRFPSPHLITYNKVLSNKHSISDNSRKVSQVSKCYFMGGNTGILNFDSYRTIIFNLFNSNWCSPLSNFCQKKLPEVSLVQLIRESVCISEDKPLSRSGQIIVVHEEYLVIRSTKPYLATRRAAIHGHYGEFLDKGDTLITLIYERSKFGDIIQGLPKVEQLSEARSINPIPRNLEESFKDWNEDMTRSLGRIWGLFISARITMDQS